MNVVAIIVSFDRKHDAIATAKSLDGIVQKVVVVDNAPDLPPLSGDVLVLHNRNVGGLAGAYNMALAHIASNEPEVTHVLFLDDDTDVTSLAEFLSDVVTLEAAEDPEIAAVAPAYVDARTELRGMHMQLERFSLRLVDRTVSEPTPVTFIINSMSLWRIEALQRLGRYSESLAVDHIDTEYCLRAKDAGMRILLNPRVAYRHTIGERRAFRFLGRQMQAGGHAPWRRRMIARNTIALGQRYALRYPAFALLSASRFVYEVVGILAAEPNKRNKLAALFRGGFEGLWSKI